VATLAEIARARKSDFRRLLKSSRSLDASQERLEREVKRLTTRKNSVPEAADAARVVTMLGDTQQALNQMAELMSAIASSWSST